MKLSWIVLLIPLAMVGVVGCGGSKSDSEQIEGVIKGYMAGIAEGDGEKACQGLEAPYQQAIFTNELSGDCPSRFEQYSSQLDDGEKSAFAETEISGIQIDGDEALACTKSPQPSPDFDNTAAYNMKKSDGEWKIASNNQLDTC